ncbi:MAG: GNAT family N-acetyltransferase [Lachnospiraceae bacterium]|nr:GNAT family N-acetyltransferase [Lachnospiraceae bacterium]
MKELVIKDTIEEYLSVSKYIDWNEESILSKADEFKRKIPDEIALIKAIYEFVRDEIKHSWDVQDKRVTKSATEVLEQGVGICWAKANLLAALLRACGIPTGICYQRLTLGDVPETGFCIHALNAVYIKSLNRWIRLDARGNKVGVDAQFDLRQERLAFSIRKELGEVDYGIVYANPSDKLMQVLEANTDALYMYLNCLPDSIFKYKKATIADIDELVRTRIIVLRAANKLSDDADMSVVEQESRTYYKRALETGEHIAYLVYDNGTFIGAGGVSFYQVMPTYHNPSGKKAYIMNMYTAPEYRRQGIAFRTLDLLVQDAMEQGVSQIALEATDMGRPLYEKYGFVKMQDEMELIEGICLMEETNCESNC